MPVRFWLIALLFVLSGAAGLVYQVVWVRQLTTEFGATIYALSTVLSAFMGGLALGAWLVGRWADGARRPLVVFGVLELAVAAAAFLFPHALDLVSPILGAVYATGSEPGFWLTSLIRFVLTGALLLVPTTLMGATLPVLARAITTDAGLIGRRVGALYALNTMGAVLGTFLTGFVLLEWLGISGTTWIAVAADAAVGVVSILLGMTSDPLDVAPLPTRHAPSPHDADRRIRRFVLATYFVSGLTALALQVAWTRSLIFGFDHLKATTYSFSGMLSVFLLGLAIGSALIQPVIDRLRAPLAAYAVLQVLLGLSSALSIYLILTDMHEALRFVEVGADGGDLNYWGAVCNVMTRSALVLGLPTLLMGMLFPVAARLVAGDVRTLGSDVGAVVAANTAGAIAGSFLGGFVLIPLLGIAWSVVLLGGLNIAIGLVAFALVPGAIDSGRRRLVLSVAGVAALAFVVRTGASFGASGFQPLSPGEKTVFYREGPLATVSVVEDVKGWRTIYVDGIGVAGTDPVIQTDQKTLAHVPMVLLGGQATRTLSVGFGAGGASWSFTRYPDIGEVHTIEITSTVPSAAPILTEANHGIVITESDYRRALAAVGPDGRIDGAANPLSAYTHMAAPGFRTFDPRYKLILDDARAYLRFTDLTYDVIATDCTDLRYKSNANLYDREYFQLCRDRISDRGLVVVWVPLAGLSDEAFRILVRTFRDVFPQMSVWYFTNEPIHYCLFIAKRGELRIDYDAVVRAAELDSIRGDLADLGLTDPAKLVASFVTDERGLDGYTGPGPLNTEDFPIIEFLSPRYGYSAAPIATNMNKLYAVQVPVAPLLDGASPRLAADLPRIAANQAANPVLFEGHTHYREHNVLKAAELYLAAQKIAPDDPSIERLLEFVEVRRLLESFAERPAGADDGIWMSSQWMAWHLGSVYHRRGKYADAVTLVRPLFDRLPAPEQLGAGTEDLRALGFSQALLIARCYHATGNAARTREFADKARAYQPDRNDWPQIDKELELR